MRPIRIGLVVLTAALLAASPDEKEAEPLKGKWDLTALTSEGQVAPDAVVKQFKAKFESKSYIQIIDGMTVEEGTYKIDSTKSPKTIDFIVESGPDKGKTQLGIYEIKNDTLTFCVTKAGSETRPDSFEAKTGSSQTLFVWKKAKE